MQKVTDGLLLTIKMACFPGEEVADSDIKAVAESIIKAARQGALEEGIENVNATVVGTFCLEDRRRLLTWNTWNIEDTNLNNHHRKLPTASSALDFTVVITGEYRPPYRPGELGLLVVQFVRYESRFLLCEYHLTSSCLHS